MNRQYARAVAQYILTKPASETEKLLDRLTATKEQREMVIEELFKLHHAEGK